MRVGLIHIFPSSDRVYDLPVAYSNRVLVRAAAAAAAGCLSEAIPDHCNALFPSSSPSRLSLATTGEMIPIVGQVLRGRNATYRVLDALRAPMVFKAHVLDNRTIKAELQVKLIFARLDIIADLCPVP